MKYEAKSRGCRVDLSVSELEVLLTLAKRGQDAPGLHLNTAERLIGDLTLALRAQTAKVDQQRTAAAARRTRAAGPDKRWHRSLTIDGHHVTASRDDYVDVGTADYAAWQSLPFLEAMNKVPAQADIRRDVWLVLVAHPSEKRLADDGPYFVGSDVTETNDPSEIEPLARRILGK